jgi:4-hydroxy-2-oxovalerate aldolase
MENKEMKKPKILEVTLRDGSYAIDFKFTANDTELIGRALEKAGFEMIEIGHGVGLGASKKGIGIASETDETYLKVGAETFNHASWGMFCIPGIAELEDVDLAASYGMDFIRIGTDVDKVEESKKFIERAKKHNISVSANFMKSYGMKPKLFAEKAVLSQKFGTDILCIVDSAGGMLTNEMEDYFHAVQDICDIPLGFHGHNNLELAVANSIRAVELGAVVVDTSLQGMGRSSGNTPTEIFISVMERKKIRMGFDPLEVMDIGEKYIKPLITKHGYKSLDIISGYSQFHSSYMGIIREYSEKYSVDPRKLIIEVCEENKINASHEMVERIAVKLSKEPAEVFTSKFWMDEYYGNEQQMKK